MSDQSQYLEILLQNFKDLNHITNELIKEFEHRNEIAKKDLDNCKTIEIFLNKHAKINQPHVNPQMY